MLANTYAQVQLLLQSYGALTVLGAIVIVGISRIILRYLSARNRAKTAHVFRERFHAFTDSSGQDTQAYERLAFLAERMGNAMGRHALVDAKPPFHGHSAKTYITVLQFIPELRMHFADLQQGGYGLGNDGANWIYHSIDDALMRFLGDLDEVATSATRKLINPIAWFREGVERTLALPLYVLSWFGLMKPASAARAEQHGFFRAVAGLTTIIAVIFIGATLTFGEQQTTATYRRIADTTVRTIDGSFKSLVGLAGSAKRVITEPKQQ